MLDKISGLINLLDQGKYEVILDKVKKYLSEDLENIPYYLIFQIEVLLLQGKVEKSEELVMTTKSNILSNELKIASLTQEAIIYWLKGEINHAHSKIQEAKEVDIHSNKPLSVYWLSYMYNASGIIYILLGEPQSAKTELELSYKFAKNSGSLRKVTSSLDNLAIVHRLLGNFDIAIFYQDKGLKLREEMNDQHGIALSKGNLAELYEVTGDLSKSLEFSKEIIPVFKEHGTKEEVGMCYHNIGRIYFQLDDLRQAQENFEKAFDYRKIAENKVRLAQTMYFRIVININLNNVQPAKELLEEFSTYPTENKVIRFQYNLANAHYQIATKEELEEPIKSLENLIESNNFDIELNLIAMITLIRAYIIDYENYGNQISDTITKLKKIAYQKNNTILEIQLLILKSKLELINQNVENAVQLLDDADTRSAEHDFKRIREEVLMSKEHIGTNYNYNKELSYEELRTYLDHLLRTFHGY